MVEHLHGALSQLLIGGKMKRSKKYEKIKVPKKTTKFTKKKDWKQFRANINKGGKNV